MTCRIVSLFALITAASGPAQAAHRVALLPPDSSGGTSKEMLRTVEDALAELAASATGVETVAGAAIKKKVRADTRACGEEPACLARLGRRLKVDEVVAVRVRTHGAGLRLTFLAVGVDNRRLLRTVSVNVESADAIEAAVKIRLAKILGVKQSELFAAAEPTPDDLPLEAMPSLAPLPGADDLKPPEKKEPETVVAKPVSEKKDEVAVVPPPEREPRRPPDEGSSWMWYSGLGMIGVGAALGGVGTFFGTRYLSKKSSIDEDGLTPQKPALRLQDEANDARRNGIILGVAAGVVGAAGIAFVIADLVTDDVDVNVSVQPGGAQATATFTW